MRDDGPSDSVSKALTAEQEALVEVPEEQASVVVDALNATRVKGRKPKARRDRDVPRR